MNKSNKKKLICINGESWCRPLTGIERLAIEVTQILDTLVKPNQVELILPQNAKNVPELKNIRKVILPVNAGFMPKWTQIHFQKYVIKNKAISLNFSNTCPYFVPGIEFIHDIYCKLFKKDFTSRRDKKIVLYSTLMYRRIAKKAKEIITVSEYTKKTIIDSYHTKPEKISVVYSGLSQEYKNLEPDFSIFEKFPVLKEKPFYFTLGSLSKRKNLLWILKHAELYPNEFFVVSGKALNNVIPEELEELKNLKNILLAGYLKDEEVKAIYTKAKAFIFPTYFEGFGLPPLEALSMNCPIIISDSTCLPEIYGKCAHYINPNDPSINLDEVLKQKTESPKELLEKFTLKNTAERLYKIIEKYLRGNL